MAFTSEQQVQIDRLSTERLPDLVLEKLEKRTVGELRARVNILSVGTTIEFSDENDYTTEEVAYIEAVAPRSKWMTAVPELLERATILEAAGLPVVAVIEILRK